VSSRLDLALVERDLVRSRNQGREFILSGLITVNGEQVLKPSLKISAGDTIEISDLASRHRVGRGYDKLRRFLDTHPLDFSDLFVVDAGASTGGFTQIALEGGAGKVLAVELGHEQLAADLLKDPRVESREGLDIRKLTIPQGVCDILLMDLSFISLLEVLPNLELPLSEKAVMVVLIKPQFEMHRSRLTSAGEVRYPKESVAAFDRVIDCIQNLKWCIVAREIVKPGPDQVNGEYFVMATRSQAGE
jgi:23S rRNA (cytidine1920-2'-O)/16S rRNA (cytidine1409-2'-O)-methyltransferase